LKEVIMQADQTSPIGVFDSGVGGLTVARAIMDRLPGESILYFGDTARVPYGVKSVETIARYATQIAEFLIERRVKLLVVACNTMAAVAFQTIRDLSPVPVLEVIEAGARGALARTRNHRIGVIATSATVASGAYVRAIKGLGNGCTEIVSQACPLFVPLAEEGWTDHEVTRLTAREYLGPVLAQDVDTLVLGCTHYPLLKPLLREVAGPGVELVDSAEAVSERAELLLRDLKLANPGLEPPRHVFHVTDVPMRFQEVGERFLGRPLGNVQLVKW
jgi:glutamate racemase